MNPEPITCWLATGKRITETDMKDPDVIVAVISTPPADSVRVGSILRPDPSGENGPVVFGFDTPDRAADYAGFPNRLFRVSGEPFGHASGMYLFRELEVVSEEPLGLCFGPSGDAVLAFARKLEELAPEQVIRFGLAAKHNDPLNRGPDFDLLQERFADHHGLAGALKLARVAAAATLGQARKQLLGTDPLAMRDENAIQDAQAAAARIAGAIALGHRPDSPGMQEKDAMLLRRVLYHATGFRVDPEPTTAQSKIAQPAIAMSPSRPAFVLDLRPDLPAEPNSSWVEL